MDNSSRLVLGVSLLPLAVLLLAAPLTAHAQSQVRILQSNAAGDRVHIIDPVTNRVVGRDPGHRGGPRGHGISRWDVDLRQ